MILKVARPICFPKTFRANVTFHSSGCTENRKAQRLKAYIEVLILATAPLFIYYYCLRAPVAGIAEQSGALSLPSLHHLNQENVDQEQSIDEKEPSPKNR